MILVLKGADASQNNIGTIELPAELTAFTRAAIAASGNDTMTTPQKLALNDFFLTLQDEGIWSKLNKVYLPIITNSLQKSFVNYNGNNVDVVPSDSYTLRNRGIANGTNADITTNVITIPNFVFNWDDISVFSMQTENTIAGGLKYMTVLNSYAGNQRVEFTTPSSATLGNSIKGYIGSSSINGVNSDGNSITTPTFIGISANSSLCKIMVSNEMVVDGQKNQVTATLTQGNLYPYATSVYGGISKNALACGMIIIGSYLTEVEMLKMQAKATALYNAFMSEE